MLAELNAVLSRAVYFCRMRGDTAPRSLGTYVRYIGGTCGDVTWGAKRPESTGTYSMQRAVRNLRQYCTA
jgi:hypothetical protein